MHSPTLLTSWRPGVHKLRKRGRRQRQQRAGHSHLQDLPAPAHRPHLAPRQDDRVRVRFRRRGQRDAWLHELVMEIWDGFEEGFQIESFLGQCLQGLPPATDCAFKQAGTRFRHHVLWRPGLQARPARPVLDHHRAHACVRLLPRKVGLGLRSGPRRLFPVAKRRPAGKPGSFWFAGRAAPCRRRPIQSCAVDRFICTLSDWLQIFLRLGSFQTVKKGIGVCGRIYRKSTWASLEFPYA